MSAERIGIANVVPTITLRMTAVVETPNRPAWIVTEAWFATVALLRNVPLDASVSSAVPSVAAEALTGSAPEFATIADPR